MSNLRRYEILLPLKFNDGQSVPFTLIGDTLVDPRKLGEHGKVLKVLDDQDVSPV